MKVIGLVSGGKDSCYNLVECVAAGHEIVALANLKPQDSQDDEIDSQMYQTVGTSAVEFIAAAMELPLFVETIMGAGKSTDKDYTPTKGDEVEDLYRLLSRVAKETGAEAVSVGAILSDYQRVRVEGVCLRLNLVCLAYLWRRDQEELLHEMIENGLEAVLIKVACLGLNSQHLGKTLGEMESTLLTLQEKYGANVCGEGGEFETYTLDSPLFKKRLEIVDKTVIKHSTDAFAPVSYLHIHDVHLRDKNVPKNLTQTELLDWHKITNIAPHDRLGSLVPTSSSHTCPAPEIVRVDSVTPEVKMDFPGEGWVEVTDIPGLGESPTASTLDAFTRLQEILQDLGSDLSCLVRVSLYVASMEEYPEINRAYTKYFGLNPPVRVCVALGPESLPKGCGLSMSVRGWLGHGERKCLHVQGISHWAPSNIGPYSQGVLAGSLVHISGQIALVPGSMKLVPEPAQEPALAFRHALRVLQALEPSLDKQNISSAVCYVVDTAGADLVQSFWSLPINLKVLTVKQLPRSANFEWEIVATLPPTTTCDTDSDN